MLYSTSALQGPQATCCPGENAPSTRQRSVHLAFWDGMCALDGDAQVEYTAALPRSRSTMRETHQQTVPYEPRRKSGCLSLERTRTAMHNKSCPGPRARDGCSALDGCGNAIGHAPPPAGRAVSTTSLARHHLAREFAEYLRRRARGGAMLCQVEGPGKDQRTTGEPAPLSASQSALQQMRRGSSTTSSRFAGTTMRRRKCARILRTALLPLWTGGPTPLEAKFEFEEGDADDKQDRQTGGVVQPQAAFKKKKYRLASRSTSKSGTLGADNTSSASISESDRGC